MAFGSEHNSWLTSGRSPGRRFNAGGAKTDGGFCFPSFQELIGGRETLTVSLALTLTLTLALMLILMLALILTLTLKLALTLTLFCPTCNHEPLTGSRESGWRWPTGAMTRVSQTPLRVGRRAREH